MESEHYFYVALFLYWLVSQVLAAAKKTKAKSPRPEPVRERTELPKAPPPLPVRTADPAEGAIEVLGQLEKGSEATLPELDEKVRAQVAFYHERFRSEASALRRELAPNVVETSANRTAALRQANASIAFHHDLLQAGRMHSTIRARREIQGPGLIADRLVADFYKPEKADGSLAPPVAIVWDVAGDDRLRTSPLAPSTLFMARSATSDPSHWSLFADPLTRYIETSAPELHQDIYDALGLGGSEAGIGADAAAITRVLFASWLHRILADAVGALFFGPAYLRALARLYARPDAPASVTSIHLNTDGSIHAEPPPHVRVHVTAQWVARMGYDSEAADVRNTWDESHGEPTMLGLMGSISRLPAAPVLEAAASLVDQLFQAPLPSLGGTRLEYAPGLSDWSTRAQDARDAKVALPAGERARGSARAIVAGAIDAAIESPDALVTIHASLYESLSQKSVPKRQTKRAAAPTTPSKGWTRQNYAEALILGEILLEPRSR